MKRILAAAVFLVVTATLSAGPGILIQADIDTKVSSKVLVGWVLENEFDSAIRKRFPCADCLTKDAVITMADFARRQALVGAGSDAFLDQLAGASGARHLVRITLTAPMPSTWILSAVWIDSRNERALAREMQTVPRDDSAVIDACRTMAAKIADRAAYFEICPYRGPVKIQIHSSRNKETKTDYPVFCNGIDGRYSRKESLNTVSDLKLDLTRTGVTWATGTGSYSSTELFELLEEDPCHDCGGGRQGVRIYTETKRESVAIEGLSEQSRRQVAHLSEELQKVSDVRLYLKFSEDGTYHLHLLAASKTGTRHVRIERKAEGNCDTKIEKPKEQYDVLADISVPYIIGPFQGTPLDAVLTGKQEFRVKDPATNEETTINIEFQLRRD